MQGAHTSQVRGQGFFDHGREHGDAIFVAFAFAHNNVVGGEVNIFHAEAQPFAHTFVQFANCSGACESPHELGRVISVSGLLQEQQSGESERLSLGGRSEEEGTVPAHAARMVYRPSLAEP